MNALPKGIIANLMALTTLGIGDVIPQGHIHTASCHHSKPWDNIQLTKAERKGKTPEEIQAIRKAKYERE